MQLWQTAQKSQTFWLIVSHLFPHSLSICSSSFHFLILFPCFHSLSISSFSVDFLILCPFPHSLSISSFSVYFLILCPYPHSLSISSRFLHFLSISSSFSHYLSISSQPGCKAATIPAALLPVTALALSAHGPFGPARFARGLDKKLFYLVKKVIQ